MSAPRSGVSDESMVNVDEGPKSVGWHDHHGMELTHVREFEPSEPSDSDDELRSPRGRGDAVTGCCVIQ